MSTPSQAAFEATYPHLAFTKDADGKYQIISTRVYYRDFNVAFLLGEAHGRKQALEDFKLLLTALVDASDYYAVENIDQYHIEADAMRGLLT